MASELATTGMTAAEQVQQVVERTEMVQHAMQAVMQKGEHYGTIPGCGDKPTLLKPGAEKLMSLFQLTPEITIEREDYPGLDGHNLHREYVVTTVLRHRETGKVWGMGVGSCSTLEKKYRYRGVAKECPSCGEPNIRKSKGRGATGWYCWAKTGGCGETFAEDPCPGGDRPVPNPDLADVWNTVLKMGKKRSMVDAVLTCTAASDLFTQDIEDLRETLGDLPNPNRRPFNGDDAKGAENPPEDTPATPEIPEGLHKPLMLLCDAFSRLDDKWSGRSENDAWEAVLSRAAKLDRKADLEFIETMTGAANQEGARREDVAREEAAAKEDEKEPPPPADSDIPF